MNFKLWLENEEFPLEPSEYDPPNEKEMEVIRKKPLSCQYLPSLRGDHFRFKMPMGETEDYIVKLGSKIGLKTPIGSLNARCRELAHKRDRMGLYGVLQYVLGNHNEDIRKQLYFHYFK